jgi:hypothetical protein
LSADLHSGGKGNGLLFFPKVVAERYLEKTKDFPANILLVEVGNPPVLRHRFTLLI